MQIENTEKINPLKDSVIIEIQNLVEMKDSLIDTSKSDEESVAIRFGIVISMGPDVALPEHCESLKVGDTVVFTQFAGYHISSTKGFYKVIRGYDVVGITTDMNDMNEDTVVPTANRVLVKELQTNVDDDGLILSGNASDPRLSDMAFGEIISCGPSIRNKDLVQGLRVAYPPYVGTEVRNYESTDNPALKIIVEEDILLTI